MSPDITTLPERLKLLLADAVYQQITRDKKDSYCTMLIEIGVDERPINSPVLVSMAVILHLIKAPAPTRPPTAANSAKPLWPEGLVVWV